MTTPKLSLASAPTSHRLTRRDLLPLAGAAALAATLAPTTPASAQTAPASDTAEAANAQRRFVYVGTYTAPNTAPGGTKPSTAVGIYVFQLRPATGLLSQVQVVPDIPNPSWLTLDPQQRFLYAISEVTTWNGVSNSGGVTAFAIDPATGKLSKLNDQPTMGAITAHDVVDPTGKDLLVANYASDPNTGASFVVLPIHADGTLGAASNVFSPNGRGPNPDRQLSPHPHQVHFDPAGRYVFGPDLGTDRIWSWTLDTAAGKLVPNSILPYAQVASGSGPRHMDFHPSGRFVYVIDEMASSITAFTYNSTQGTFLWIQTVSTLPAESTGTSTTAEILVHPSGRFVYGSNRGHDSIVGFAIDQTTGKLRRIGWWSTQGHIPRSFNIDPSGALLLVGNQDTDTIVPFRIDQRSGELVWTGAVTQTPTPVCIQFGRPVRG